GLEADQAADAMVLVDDVVARPQLEQARQAPAGRDPARRGAAAAQELVVRDEGEPEVARDEAVADGQAGEGPAAPARGAGRRAATAGGRPRRRGGGRAGAGRPRARARRGA